MFGCTLLTWLCFGLSFLPSQQHSLGRGVVAGCFVVAFMWSHATAILALWASIRDRRLVNFFPMIASTLLAILCYWRLLQPLPFH